MFAVENADATMSVNARNCVKGTTLTTQCFCLFYFHLTVLLQQVFCKIPASQIIISTYDYLIYYLLFKKNHTDNALGKVFLLN